MGDGFHMKGDGVDGAFIHGYEQNHAEAVRMLRAERKAFIVILGQESEPGPLGETYASRMLLGLELTPEQALALIGASMLQLQALASRIVADASREGDDGGG
jgi:hypothetical protein